MSCNKSLSNDPDQGKRNARADRCTAFLLLLRNRSNLKDRNERTIQNHNNIIK